ncbi:MAG: Ezrin/radixin/moesin family protein [Cytophagales bacterium]|nr:Ezrin/radixin/moesin family protein [Cytophagales bacterium]
MSLASEALFAQKTLSRNEKKEWKKKKNAMSLEQFKQFSEDHAAMKSKMSGLSGKIESLEDRLQNKTKEANQKEEKVRELTQELNALRQEKKAEPAAAAKSSDDYSKGVAFKVQIGAFRNKDLSKYFDNNENFGGEISEDGTQRITLGVFRDYWNADTFKKYLREMGVKDAWIVAYKNGKRVPIKAVLEGVM